MLFWVALLFISLFVITGAVQHQNDIRQKAAEKQKIAQAFACIPAGGSCRPAGQCLSGETDLSQRDCSADGSLTCCAASACLGGNCGMNITITQYPTIP